MKDFITNCNEDSCILGNNVVTATDISSKSHASFFRVE